jgi:hypothetical protein
MPEGSQNPPTAVDTKPWWERPQFCTQRQDTSCAHSFFTQLECREEPGPDGRPIKRCVRLHKRLVQCPDRPPHVDEEKREETMWPAVDAERHLLGAKFDEIIEDVDVLPSSRTHLRAQPPDLGEALEQIIMLAEDLQEGMAPCTSGVRLDTPPQGGCRHPSPSPSTELQSGDEKETLLARLFGWGQQQRRHRRRDAVNGGSSSRTEAWTQWAREFQET